MDNHHTLGMRGVEIVNYADVFGGADGFTMVLRLIGGTNARLEAPFIIFKNRDRNYPIKNFPDDIDGVSYYTRLREWMDNNVFIQWLQEPRAICKDPEGRSGTLFLNNCSCHRLSNSVSEALNNILTSLAFLPRSATHLCQPLDSFIIQKLKACWRKQWEAKKV